MPYPSVLADLAWVSLIVACGCAGFIIIDIARGRRQSTGIMEVTWPVTGLYMGPLGLFFYLWFGRAPARGGRVSRRSRWQGVFVSASHCGGGCTLGDIIAEGTLYLTGWRLAGNMLASSYLGDFGCAYLLGIWFQYLPIRAARGLAPRSALVAAIKADTLSLMAFEAGLFAWMALVDGVWFPGLKANDPVFWFMMQIGMGVGFITTYPANWWLVRQGIKDGM